MQVMKNLLCIIFVFLMLVNNSCSLVDPTTQAQAYSRQGKFEEAVKILEKEYTKQSDSVPIKSLLAQAYSDYGLALCQDQNKPPRVKYPLAKEQFAKALTLNPYLKDAKDMHEMIEKIQASFAANKID